MKSKFAPSQITLHWLVFILIAIAYATIELRGYADRGTALRAAMISTHFGCGAAVQRCSGADANVMPNIAASETSFAGDYTTPASLAGLAG